MNTQTAPLIEVQSVSKIFGSVNALKDISMKVNAGEVVCLLGDNGAGKSTLIKILSGVHQPSEGSYLFEGKEMHFSLPRDALAMGIATVFQDLAMIPLMGISRNSFLGSEPTKGWGPFRRFNVKYADQVTREELAKMGIQVRETTRPVGTLSGGERQSVAISRAVYFGAKVLILDEPTAALGVKEAGVVLRYIAQARSRELGVIFITHNPHHAYPIGDHFTILNRGSSYGTFAKSEISREELTGMMAGSEALEELSHELAEFARGIDEHKLRQPVGVVTAITPFNFPSMIPLWYLPYAIACGNCFILKPSEKVPMTMSRVFALLDHPLVRAISFVGSSPVAKNVYSRAAANGKRAQCAGGAKNPVVVLPDADMEMATRIIADSSYGFAGQRCLATSVTITVGEAGPIFSEHITDVAAERKVGYGLGPEVEMGPVITAESKQRIESLIGKGVHEGARVLVEGRNSSIPGYERGFFVRPTQSWTTSTRVARLPGSRSSAICMPRDGTLLSSTQKKRW